MGICLFDSATRPLEVPPKSISMLVRIFRSYLLSCSLLRLALVMNQLDHQIDRGSVVVGSG